jgi:threonine synthase
VRAIRDTNGVVLDVSDAEILEAKAVIDASGVGCEPASAASVAGARRLVRQGTIARGDRVVAILTGHILKDPGILIDYHKDATRPLANVPMEIDAEIGAVERVLAESASSGRT